MGLLDVLNQYAHHPDRPPPQVFDDFDQVSQAASHEDLSQGLQDAFNSEATPPFEQMVAHLYDRSDEPTRAGLLQEILGALGGGALAGQLGRDPRQVEARDVEVAAAEAARHNPGVIQTVSRFYARHPQLVQSLGQAALGILMSGMARRRRGL